MTEQPKPRIFKIGATTIVEDESMVDLKPEQIRDLLKRTYPEVAHATLRETTRDDGTPVLEFHAKPGRKG